jgi:hypothetical protein
MTPSKLLMGSASMKSVAQLLALVLRDSLQVHVLASAVVCHVAVVHCYMVGRATSSVDSRPMSIHSRSCRLDTTPAVGRRNLEFSNALEGVPLPQDR